MTNARRARKPAASSPAVDDVGELVTGVQLLFNGIAAVARKASFAIALGALFLAAAMIACDRYQVASTPAVLLSVAAVTLGSLAGIPLDDIYRRWRRQRQLQAEKDDAELETERLKVEQRRARTLLDEVLQSEKAKNDTRLRETLETVRIHTATASEPEPPPSEEPKRQKRC